ncbi:MAG: hypothetical protein ACXACG_14600 [Candidatus Thorarchaeota archaeon]
MSTDWLATRVAVVLLAIIGPIYFFLLMFFIPEMTPFGDTMLDWLFHYIAVPIVFSAPWLGLIYYQRFRLANTVYIMDDTISSVPLRWRVFYGINAAFVLMLFVLPMTTPLLAIILGLFVAGTAFYRIGVGKFGGGKPGAALAVLAALALCVLPTFVMLEFLPNYIASYQPGSHSGCRSCMVLLSVLSTHSVLGHQSTSSTSEHRNTIRVSTAKFTQRHQQSGFGLESSFSSLCS